MPESPAFLSGKFHPAALPAVYAPRHKLLAELHEAATDGFIYINAPAGSGKTVTAQLWLAGAGREAVWIGLDAYDNAVAVFYKQLATGLFATQADNGNMRALLEQAAFFAAPVEQTIALILEMRPDTAPRALILDDLHLITNRDILKSLPFVIKRLPQNFMVMMLSRTELPLSFNNLIKQERDIISAARLRFTSSEIRGYYKSLGLTLKEEEIEAAQIATEGWAIGVNAIAQSGDYYMKQGGNIFKDFFEDHIWNNWDQAMRDFCLKTSVVDEFVPELAARLSGRSEAREIMEALARSNCFISRVSGDTYRYHHLLLDFLREAAVQSNADLAALNKSAAHYYIESKDYSLALRFWLASGDYKGADKFLFLFMFKNQHGDLAGYADFLRLYFIRDFPAKAFADFPALHICCAWYYYLTGQYKEYERHADAAYKQIVRIALYDPKFVEFAMLMYSVDHRSEMLDKLKRFGIFGKLVKIFTSDGIIRDIASFTHNLPYAHRSSFDYSAALATAQNLAKIRKSAFIPLLGDQSEFIIRLGLAGLCYERNDLPTALAEIEALCGDLTAQNSVELRASAMFLRHSILQRLERSTQATLALVELTSFVKSTAPFFAVNLEAYKVKLALFNSDKEKATRWLDNYYVVDVQRIELFLLFQHFTTARAYLVLGEIKNARRYLTMLREFGQNLNRTCDYNEASILLAALEWAAGNQKEAVLILESALERMQRFAYLRQVIDEGASILPPLKRLAAKIGSADYRGPLKKEFISELVIETYRFSKQYKGVTANITYKNKPVKLSNQQLLMITLLAKGYSNAMIIQETGLKITTIKTHTALAYRKLGVSNMMDAVIKARELGLLSAR